MITWLLWCKKQKNTSTENRLIQKPFTKKCVFFKIGIFPSSKCILHNSNLRNVKVNGNVANVAFSAHCSAELKNIFEKGNDKTSPIKPVSPAEVISLCMVERLCCFKWDANQMQPCAQKGSDSLIISVQCSEVFVLLLFFCLNALQIRRVKMTSCEEEDTAPDVNLTQGKVGIHMFYKWIVINF